MNNLIKKISAGVLAGLVLIGGPLGNVSSVYANSVKFEFSDRNDWREPYVWDVGYQKLLKYSILGYSLDIMEAIKIANKYVNEHFPVRGLYSKHFNSGYEFIEFLIKDPCSFKVGIYLVKIRDAYYAIKFYN